MEISNLRWEGGSENSKRIVAWFHPRFGVWNGETGAARYWARFGRLAPVVAAVLVAVHEEVLIRRVPFRRRGRCCHYASPGLLQESASPWYYGWQPMAVERGSPTLGSLVARRLPVERPARVVRALTDGAPAWPRAAGLPSCAPVNFNGDPPKYKTNRAA
jgi:hypothetical protein